MHTSVTLMSVGAQEVHGPFDPTALQIAVWCLAERCLELANEVGLRNMRDPCQPRDVERQREVAIHCVASPQETAIGLLTVARHPHIAARAVLLP